MSATTVIIADQRPRVIPAGTRPQVSVTDGRPRVIVQPGGRVQVTAPAPQARVVIPQGRPVIQTPGPVRVILAGQQGPAGIPGSAGNLSPVEEVPAGAIDGTNAEFTLAHVPQLLVLWKNGLAQQPGPTNDYTLTGSVVTFNAGLAVPRPGDSLYAFYLH